MGILPEHLLATVPVRELSDAPFNAGPVGTGPYQVEALDSREARLRRYENYHLGAPGIERLTLRFYSDDASTIRALQSGDVGGILLRGSIAQWAAFGLNRSKTTTVTAASALGPHLLY